jgi:hypothetical protein
MTIEEIEKKISKNSKRKINRKTKNIVQWKLKILFQTGGE